MAKLDLKDFKERIQAIFEYGIPTDFSHGSRGDDLHQRKNKKPKKDKDAWASEVLARHHPNRLLKKKMSAKEATEYLGIPEGYVEETENNTKKDKFDHEGYKKWQKDAKNVDKKEYNKWRKEVGVKEGRRADIKGEIVGTELDSRRKQHPLKGDSRETELDSRRKQHPLNQKLVAQRYKKMRAGEFAKAHGKQWKKVSVKEEQKRVIESLANLLKRGIGHKPIQKKKSNIDPGKAVRKETAERLQKTAKARIRATTTRQKFGEGYKALAWHYRKKEADKREKVTKDHGKITNKITNPTPSMHHIKDTMWGKEEVKYPKSAIKDMNKQSDKHDKTWWKDQDKAQNKFKFNSWRHIIKDLSKKKLKEAELPPHLAKFINPKTGNLKSKYEKRMNKPHVLSSKKPKFTVKDVTPKGYGPDGFATGIPVDEDAASGRPIKKPVTKIKKKDSGKDGAFLFSSPKSNVIGSYSLRNKIGAKMGLKPIVAETMAGPWLAGRPKDEKDRRLLSAKPKGKWIGKRIKKYSQPIHSIGQAALTAGDLAINNKLGIIIETGEYKAAMGPGSHEWGTDIGRDYFKKLTPGQDNPPEDPIKPLSIKAKKPEDYKGVKVTEGDAWPPRRGDTSANAASSSKHYAKFKIGTSNPAQAARNRVLKNKSTDAAHGIPARYDPSKGKLRKKIADIEFKRELKAIDKQHEMVEEEAFSLDSIVSKQAEYTKEKYPEANEVNARWQANLDGILTGAYEGGKITWADVEALDKEAENITFDQEVVMGLYEPDELEANDFDDDPYNDTEILEVLSVQGRMKRRFAARRNRQMLTVARGIAMRRGSTPERLKRRATRGARLMVYKRLLRGRDRSALPPAEKSRLETMIKRFQPLVNRIAVKLAPQMRRNELKRLSNRGKSAATVGKKFKAAKPIRGAASQKAKRYKIKKPGKFKSPKPKPYKMRGASGGPTIKRSSKQYKAFSYSVG